MVTAVLLLLFLLLLVVGQWQSTSTGAQIQVPMFYDLHYLFPRAWTQAQEVPGVPEAAPLAFYGANSVSQSFISGADQLTMLEVWLAGDPDTAVSATLSTAEGQHYQAEIPLSAGRAGRLYSLQFPPIADAEGRRFTLRLSAPEATFEQPVVTHTVGGDKLGGVLLLNEYGRPGNLQLYSYVTGAAFFDALGEQLLPDLFRLRLQQFKSAPFKGNLFVILFVAMLLLSGLFLFWARPSGQKASSAVGWLLAGLFASFLLWQLGDGRLQLPLFAQMIVMEEKEPFVAITPKEIRIANDMITTLWTAERLPEERFIETTTLAERLPAIRVPAQSQLVYTLDVPLNGRLRLAIQSEKGTELLYKITFNGQELFAERVGDELQWVELPLTPFGGQGGRLTLRTEPLTGSSNGYWIMPQILTEADWLLNGLPADAQPTTYQLGEDVSLNGYKIEAGEGNEVAVTLFWQTKRPLTTNGTIFIHALDANGEILAQQDAQPVQNSYPLTVWPTDLLIADTHTLTLPDDASVASFAVGLYDPVDFTRWPIWDALGSLLADGRILLPITEQTP